MTIEFRLQEKKYVVLMLKRTYPRVLFLSIMLLCFFGWIFFSYAQTSTLKPLGHAAVLTFFVSLMLVWPFLSLGFKFRGVFRSNKMLQEKMNITLEKGFMQIDGESYTSRAQLSKLYTIVELKDYFLFYHGKRVFNIIPKYAIGNNLASFKSFINTNSI